MRATLGACVPLLFFVLVCNAVLYEVRAEKRHYQVLEGSTYLDDCAVCDRLSIVYPLRGEFDLVTIEENSLFSRYSLTDLRVVAGFPPVFELKGEGQFQIGGEVALLQGWVLNFTITSDHSTNFVVLTNSTRTVDRALPNISVSCTQSNGSLFSTIYLDLKAAPVEEIWFLTRKPAGSLRVGDILSSRGRLVKSQAELFSELGVVDPPPGVTLDALDIRAGYRFSLSAEVTNSFFGPIHNGDFVSGRSKIVSLEQWAAAFGIPKEAPDPGLDAVHFLDSGDTLPVDLLFSIVQPVFSPKLNRMLGRGDLLAFSYGSRTDGSVRRSNAQLLERFHPPDRQHDYGLDGVYLWQHGEIWFSVQEGFLDGQLGPVSEGDLLSDGGFIVFRNADLVRNFSAGPPDEVGLSDFFVITDLGWPGTPWVLNAPAVDIATGDVALSWHTSLASGVVVQLEKTPRVGLPFEAISPIITETRWTDTGVVKSNRSGIYRLREWR